MAKLLLLGPAHEAAGRRDDEFDGATLDDVLSEAVDRYGGAFGALLKTCQVWVNGEPADGSAQLGPQDVVSVLPPVSGG